jgi:hypothetical protein
MIPFRELQELAEQVGNRVNKYVEVAVKYHVFTSSEELEYTLYVEDFKINGKYHTAQDLKAAMEKILKPVEDEEISV